MRFGGLIVAIVVAIIAAVIAFRMLGNDKSADGQAPQAQPAKTVTIYVAAKPITIGTVIKEDMIAVQPWPEQLMLEGFVKTDQGPGKVVGTVARSAFQQQEPILSSKLANPNDPNFLAGELPKGMRVITIPTNETEGIAGFVFPGDRVDVLLTHEVDKPRPPLLEHEQAALVTKPITETLITNVMVLAVDQRATGAQSTDEKGNLIIPRSVSLMVSLADAQRIRLAQKSGTLTLALRALADRDTVDPLTVTTTDNISQYKLAPGGSNSDEGVIVHRGAPRDNAEGGNEQKGGVPYMILPQMTNSGARR